jgi:hypothetical protein
MEQEQREPIENLLREKGDAELGLRHSASTGR